MVKKNVRDEKHIQDSFKKPKQKGHVGDFADLNKICVRMWSEFILLRIGHNSGFS
jgi:hypothetical protein